VNIPLDITESGTENEPLKKTVRFKEGETIIKTEPSDNNWSSNELEEEDYEERVSDVPENTPAKKAIRNQDLEEARKRFQKKNK